MYFKEFPKFLYDFKYGDRDTRTSVVTDITRNIRVRKEILENITLYDQYDIVDGETPEIIAEKIYGNPEYHWIIMIANGRYDYVSDFPLTDDVLQRVCVATYNKELTGTWSYSGNIITVTSPYHGIQVSPTTTVTITGALATTNAPNGTYIVSTVVDENTFRFTVNSIPTGTASGSLKIKTNGKENYIHHYEREDGLKVNSDYPGAFPVTNLVFSQLENEKKRRIKIISPDLLSIILKQYKDLL
jgi:hypothetical protein